MILHPTLHHLLDKQVYVLKGEGQKPSTVCIPLWNQEATCEIDGQLTFIRCVPSLPAHMWLDDGNNLSCGGIVIRERPIEKREH